jgi:hypothetical protein
MRITPESRVLGFGLLDHKKLWIHKNEFQRRLVECTQVRGVSYALNARLGQQDTKPLRVTFGMANSALRALQQVSPVVRDAR